MAITFAFILHINLRSNVVLCLSVMLAQSFLVKCGREKETSYGETQDYNGNYRSISLVGNNILNSLVPKSNKV